jgi:saccharopine dehydrogenase-like NADP-dependent oxidoreductase
VALFNCWLLVSNFSVSLSLSLSLSLSVCLCVSIISHYALCAGWSNVMFALRSLGLMSTEPVTGLSCDSSVRDYLASLFPQGVTISNLSAFLAEKGVADVPSAVEALQWLGLTDNDDTEIENKHNNEHDVAVAQTCRGATPIDALCQLLERRLEYGPTEKDMVAMFHSIEGRLPDGRCEAHTSRLLAFGVPGGDSAMAATVGYTTAAAVELIVDNKLANTDLHGVLIPTDPRIYNPILDRLQTLGITWTDTLKHSKPGHQ